MTELLVWVIVLAMTLVLVTTPAVQQNMSRWRARSARWVKASWAEYTEFHERKGLLQRPWEEELLHWSFNGQRWELHGHLPPPRGRRRSSTSSGWCPGARNAQTRKENAA